MAINSSVYSSKQFELYIAPQTTMGTAMTASDNASFTKLEVVSVNDVDFGGGLIQERALRSGQQIKKSTDHYVSQKGAMYTLEFEWIVSHKEGLLQLMKMISEDASSAFEVAGTFSPAVYNHGDTTGNFATIIVSNPNTSDDRLLHSCVLTNLTLSMDSGSEGGRLVASGTFMSGYKPTVGANTVAPSGTQNAYVKTIYDCTTKRLGADNAANDVVAKAFSMEFSYPAMRIGYQGSDADAEQYARSGEYTASGTINVKYDAVSAPELSQFLSGSTRAVLFGDASTIDFSIPTAVYTGFNLDLGDSEEGTFVEVPFEATADGSANLFSIIVA